MLRPCLDRWGQTLVGWTAHPRSGSDRRFPMLKGSVGRFSVDLTAAAHKRWIAHAQSPGGVTRARDSGRAASALASLVRAPRGHDRLAVGIADGHSVGAGVDRSRGASNEHVAAHHPNDWRMCRRPEIVGHKVDDAEFMWPGECGRRAHEALSAARCRRRTRVSNPRWRGSLRRGAGRQGGEGLGRRRRRRRSAGSPGPGRFDGWLPLCATP